jgi:hypothetical protein
MKRPGALEDVVVAAGSDNNSKAAVNDSQVLKTLPSDLLSKETN